jgi:hypothetical protein
VPKVAVCPLGTGDIIQRQSERLHLKAAPVQARYRNFSHLCKLCHEAPSRGNESRALRTRILYFIGEDMVDVEHLQPKEDKNVL